MITHIVFWKLRPEAEGRTAAQNAQGIVHALQTLPALIDCVRSLEVGIDFERSAMAWDVALYTRFDSREDLVAYQQHPEHQKVAAFVKSVVSERAVVDFEA